MARERMTIVLDIPDTDSGQIHSILKSILSCEEPLERIEYAFLEGQKENGEYYKQYLTHIVREMEVGNE